MDRRSTFWQSLPGAGLSVGAGAGGAMSSWLQVFQACCSVAVSGGRGVVNRRRLADTLADAGMMAVTITYRTGTDGARFPVPVQDIACAVSFASTVAKEAGINSRPLVLIGHSAGAHLAAVVALAPDLGRGDCPYPAASPDALIGLAGPYDLPAVGNVAWPLLGVSAEQDPDRCREASALTYAAARPECQGHRRRHALAAWTASG